MRLPVCTALAALLLVAADDPKAAGLKPGADLPGPFTPYNITGKYQGRFHCLVCEHGLEPAALVFVRGSDVSKELEELLQALDAVGRENPKSRFVTFAVFVEDDVADIVADDDKREDLAKRLEDKGAKLEKVVLALEGKKNLAKYNLGDNNEVTVVLYDSYKVVDVQGFPKGKLDAAAIKALRTAVLEKLLRKK